MPGALGRLYPKHFQHIERYPLAALPPDARPTHTPVPIGANWYTGFDNPIQGADHKWRLPEKNIGTIRGGHCTCLEEAPIAGAPGRDQDNRAWWHFYNQGAEGACEGFGHSRALTLSYRRTYNGFWLYDDARRIEGTYPWGEGTTNDAVCQALKAAGAHPENGQICERGEWGKPESREPTTTIAAYRWATNADEVLGVLGYKTGSEIPLLNSWGEGYPEVVYLSPELLERLLREGGEASVITER